jgi:hypothetical protein
MVMMISACSNELNKCDKIDPSYGKSSIKIYKLEKVSIHLPVIQKALPTIIECYSKNKYMNLDYSFEIHEARQYKPGLYIVVGELYGVEDLRLLFEIDSKGNILGSYQGGL